MAGQLPQSMIPASFLMHEQAFWYSGHYPPAGYVPVPDFQWNPPPPPIPYFQPIPVFSTLLARNNTVLATIIEYLIAPSHWVPEGTSFYPRRRPSELKALSATSRDIRERILPWLFHTITWPGKKKHSEPILLLAEDQSFIIKEKFPDLPLRALPHVRHLVVRSDQNFVADDLVWCIPQMTGLLQCTFDCRLALPLDLVQAVLLSPQLESLQFLQTPLDLNVDRLHSSRGYRNLVIRPASGHHRINGGLPLSSATLIPDLAMLLPNPSSPWAMEKMQGAEARKRNESKTTLYFLLPHLTAPLERLEIDASLVPWLLLPQLNWSRLQTLILSGDQPMISPRSLRNQTNLGQPPSHNLPIRILDNGFPGLRTVPVIAFLHSMKQLRNLQFRWRYNPQQKFYIHPPPVAPEGLGVTIPMGIIPPGPLPGGAQEPVVDQPSVPKLGETFPHLTSLTLSNPCPDDLCFTNLPPTVEHLYLPIITRHGPSLPPAAVAMNERRARAARTAATAATRPFGLKPTEFVQIFSAVKHARLPLLGIQITLHNVFPTPNLFSGLASCIPTLKSMEIGVMFYDGRKEVATWPAYVEALKHFPNLQSLKIAIPIPSLNSRCNCLSSHPDEYKFVTHLASHLPNLDWVAVQSIVGLTPELPFPTGSVHDPGVHLNPIPFAAPPTPALEKEWNNWTRYDIVRRRVVSAEGVEVRAEVRWNEAYTMSSPLSDA